MAGQCQVIFVCDDAVCKSEWYIIPCQVARVEEMALTQSSQSALGWRGGFALGWRIGFALGWRNKSSLGWRGGAGSAPCQRAAL